MTGSCHELEAGCSHRKRAPLSSCDRYRLTTNSKRARARRIRSCTSAGSTWGWFTLTLRLH
eukprot:6975086-Alexandrium_andersonii.AAC.1